MIKQWQAKAVLNTHKWGVQSMETVCLCMTEELGELAQAILQYKQEGGTLDRITEELADLGALCFQMVDSFEDAKKRRAECIEAVG